MMLQSLVRAAASLAVVSSVVHAAPAPSSNSQPAEKVVPFKPSTQDKLEAMKQWQAQVASTADNVASKYPVDHIDDTPGYSLWDQFQDTGSLHKKPEPVNGKTGSKIYGPTNPQLDRQNPDTFAPPGTDHGTVPQSKWPFSLSHNRLQNGGWARQQNVDVLPVATDLAGVQMHLDYGALRELHWHTASEWAFVLNGTFRFSILDAEGRNSVGDLGPGDLWFAPSGLPHSIQSTSESGGEFLLVFDDGSFSEDETFLLTDFMAHVPREVVLKNFPGFNDSDFNDLPKDELYIFPNQTSIQSLDEEFVSSPQGKAPVAYTYNASSKPSVELPGGSVKIIDSRNFSISDIAMADVTVNPGAMRELHWHPNSDEWSYFLSGHARITVWAGTTNARTFDFSAGDVAYIPKSQGHFIEALGNTTVRYLELFKAPQYEDVSLSNWLSLMPPHVVQDHLGFSDAAMKKLQNFRSHDNQVVQGQNDGSGNGIGKRGVSDAPLYGGKQLWA